MHCDKKVDEAMPSGFPTGRARMGSGETGGEAAARLRRDGCKSAARRLRDGGETSGGTAARLSALSHCTLLLDKNVLGAELRDGALEMPQLVFCLLLLPDFGDGV